MAKRGGSVDTRLARRKLGNIGKEMRKAHVLAAKDAATRTRTHARRAIKLNMPLRYINRAMKVERIASNDAEYGYVTSYQATPLTWFTGWRERKILPTGQALVAGANKHGGWLKFGKGGEGGITVRFRKDKPLLRFRHGFILRRGGNTNGRAFQRAPATSGQKSGPSGLVHRMPVHGLYGPSAWARVRDNLDDFAARGREIYSERLQYHKRAAIKRATGI